MRGREYVKVTAKTEPCATYKNQKIFQMFAVCASWTLEADLFYASGTKGCELHDLQTAFGKF